MSIWLTSPTAHFLADSTRSSRTRAAAAEAKVFFKTCAGRTLIYTTLAWLVAYVYCKQTFWRDPDSWFYNASTVYDVKYSHERQIEARQFIVAANNSNENVPTHNSSPTQDPIICIGIVTVKRKAIQYLNDTIGSMLVGLTNEERSAISVQLLFADSTPFNHSDWDSQWLNELDFWSTYEVSAEQLEKLRDMKRKKKIQAKGIFGYAYILDQCLNRIAAPYIAVFEDDLVFAKGWLPKTLSALAELQTKATQNSWLYLRLFYTESIRGWDKDVDCWYTHPILLYALTMIFIYGTAFILRSHLKHRHLDDSYPTLLIITCIAVPAFVTLLFMIGRNSLMPLDGVERMDSKACCTQALIFARSQLPSLTAMLRDDKHGQTDLIIEKWANAEKLPRYALAPQVVQHVGLVSTRGMRKKFTQQTWAYGFEAYDAAKLKQEHSALTETENWRAITDSFANG